MSRLLPLLLLVGCSFAAADHAVDPEGLASPNATRVEVVTLQPSSAEINLAFPGEVVGSKDVVLAAGSGGLIESLRVDRGMSVTKGQAIARVDAQIAGAQLAQAEAQEKQANDRLRRQEALGDLGANSALEDARTNALIAEASAKGARARYARAALNAPFAGTVADIYVEEGSNASPGAPIARLVQLDPIKVMLSVSDRDVVSLEEGMPVEVLTNARSGVFEGVISHVGPAADLKTRAFPVEASIPNPDHLLLPGMIAQVHVRQSIVEGAVIVPQEWIVTKRTEQGVFIERDGAATWRPITLGDIAGDQVVILDGVAIGDRVVVTGHRDLKDGEQLLIGRSGTCCTDGRPTWGE